MKHEQTTTIVVEHIIELDPREVELKLREWLRIPDNADMQVWDDDGFYHVPPTIRVRWTHEQTVRQEPNDGHPH